MTDINKSLTQCKSTGTNTNIGLNVNTNTSETSKIKIFASYALLLTIAIFYLGVMITLMQVPRTVVYDCRIAEISPDFPIEAREQCRKLRSEKLKHDTT